MTIVDMFGYLLIFVATLGLFGMALRYGWLDHFLLVLIGIWCMILVPFSRRYLPKLGLVALLIMFMGGVYLVV